MFFTFTYTRYINKPAWECENDIFFIDFLRGISEDSVINLFKQMFGIIINSATVEIFRNPPGPIQIILKGEKL